MPPAAHLLIAFMLDLMIGDPRRVPHPVRAIGALATAMEKLTRRAFPSLPFLAGAITALGTTAASGAAAWVLLYLGNRLRPPAGDLVAVAAFYFTIALGDLRRHGRAVYRALERGDLAGARHCVGMMVGRDTEGLDEAEISRAAVESIAENSSDGVCAPLFYGVLFGPVGAVVYRSVNTLDSMFGYRNDRYHRFGWVSARMDDLLNYLPARLTALCITAAALLPGFSAAGALKTLIKDSRNHPSPNSGYPEAAAAGALEIQLGGVNRYAGVKSVKPSIGHPLKTLGKHRITGAIRLITAGSVIFFFIALAASYFRF